jgi:hypothetical protein
VLLVKEDDGSWRAYFCIKADATAVEILEAVADRASMEQVFHDVKEVHGSGQQQLRNLYSNIAAFNLNLWAYTLIELWAWGKTHKALCAPRHAKIPHPLRAGAGASRLKRSAVSEISKSAEEQ